MTVDEWKRKNPPIRKKVQTNADQLRAMTDEELAGQIERIVYCRSCPFHGKQCKGEAFVSRAACRLHWLDWLRQEATE